MGFMIPIAERFTQAEAAEYTAFDGDDRQPEEFEAGWYSRLSAPGYMDATDWMGPYATADEALRGVMEFYEVDENGDMLDEVTAVLEPLPRTLPMGPEPDDR